MECVCVRMCTYVYVYVHVYGYVIEYVVDIQLLKSYIILKNSGACYRTEKMSLVIAEKFPHFS